MFHHIGSFGHGGISVLLFLFGAVVLAIAVGGVNRDKS